MGAPQYAGIKVEGARQLRASLKRAGHDLEDLKATNRKVAEVVDTRAKKHVPVGNDIDKRGKRLRDTIRPGATKTTAIVRAGGKKVPYANPIHWGWGKRHIRPQSFLSISARATEPTWFGIYQHDIQEILNKIEGADNV
jgi:bacteriophage protein of unknown function (DUF646)